MGASLLLDGDDGLENKCMTSMENKDYFTEKVLSVKGASLAFPSTPSFNEITISFESDVDDLINVISEKGIHLGVNVSNRSSIKGNHLLVSFSDKQTKEDIDQLINSLQETLGTSSPANIELPKLPENYIEKNHAGIFKVDESELFEFYKKLSKLNVSPDENIYPLGSCTMKYNPYINDYAAGLESFTLSHPQAPIKDVQGSLQVIHAIQEEFKKITGLPGVTTQPVAGAQGELVGIKMFQAYHKANNETRDIILIPKSAHGTNPATATMAGIETVKKKNEEKGIISIDANNQGQIDIDQVEQVISTYGKRIIGIMVTNPNTSGIFESNFKEIASKIHSVGGLVYMDGANMNAIAGKVNLEDLGVDAVHNNLHKTWTIPHGGGGPGDAIVAVSDKLINFLPGYQVKNTNGNFSLTKPKIQSEVSTETLVILPTKYELIATLKL